MDNNKQDQKVKLNEYITYRRIKDKISTDDKFKADFKAITKKNPEYIEPDEYKMFDANHETIKL